MTLGEKISDNFEAIILLIGLMAIQFFNTYFPEYYMITGWVACGVIFGIIILMNVSAVYIGTQKPYLKCYTYPSRQLLKIYVEDYEYSRRIKKNPVSYFSTKILSKFTFNYNPIGKCKSLVINHEHSWQNRIDLKPGKAELRGTTIDHPNTETLILYETQMTDVDKTEPIPVFFLAHAGKDFWRERLQKEAIDTTAKSCEKCNYLEQNIELERETKELRQQVIELEQFIEKVKDALSGVQRAGAKGMDIVWDIFNEIHSLHVTIANAIKSRGIVLSLPAKLIIVAACVLAFIGLAAFRPELFTQFSQFLANPMYLGLVTACVVFAILVVYWMIRRRRY